MTRRAPTTAHPFTPEDSAVLESGAMPSGAELVRIRTELVEICREHCGPETVRLAEESLARAVVLLGAAPAPRRGEQLELFGKVA